MRFTVRLAVVLAALYVPTAVAGGGSKSDKNDREYIETIRSEARELLRALEHLEEDVIDELGKQQDRKLYSQIQSAISAASVFLASLEKSADRTRLYDSFSKLDDQLHEVIEKVDAVKSRALRRSAARVRAADDQLHYFLSIGDPSEVRSGAVLKRQGSGLADAAANLERVASYSVGTATDAAPLLRDLTKLSRAAKHLAGRLDAGVSRKEAERDFAEVTKAWDKVTEELRRLPPAEHLYLLRSAGQLDRLHERLHRLLGVKGERPRLIIRT